jgi:pimeloyl-ACP methyl ester carboxylesterase
MTNLEHVVLSDGRKLAYEQFGAENGVPVIYNHGWPSSRLECRHLVPIAEKTGVKLISVDRPGMGGSDFQPNRALLDWPNDISQLADHLCLDKFHILGVSGGGPYVSVCAYKIPERLLGAAIIAGVTPMTNPRTKHGMRMMNRILLNVGKPAPWLLNWFMKYMQNVANDTEKLKRALSDLPEVDKQVMTGDTIDELAESAQECLRQGTAGATQDGRIYALPWGFELNQIDIPVTVWQGSLDVNVPLSNGQILAESIPNVSSNFIDGEGHFSILINHGETMLTELIG